MEIIIISGRSGAGKSVALKAIEDSGYYCVDNLPLVLLPQLINMLALEQAKVAISLDIRNIPQSPEVLNNVLIPLKENNDVKIIFLDSEHNILIQRYSDSRRLHPLSQQDLSLETAIKKEKVFLLPIIQEANIVINTTSLSTHELAEKIRFFVMGEGTKELNIIVESFGFKYGIPLDADYVFDVRFLPNPHWDPELRPLTGLDKPVADFLSQHKEVNQFIYQTRAYLEHWLPMLEQNNRSYLTITIGCTGGKHRSVYIAQKLGEYFQSKGKKVQIKHRSLANYC